MDEAIPGMSLTPVARLLGLLDALPRWLRWAVFLPVGVLCSVLVAGVLEAGLSMAGLPPVHPSTVRGMARPGVIMFVAGVTLTLFPAVLSPRPWPVGLVMFAIGLALRVVPAVYHIIATPYMRPRMLLVGLAIGINALGGCLGLYLIRRLELARKVTPAEA
jgi:hypothetical protein